MSSLVHLAGAAAARAQLPAPQQGEPSPGVLVAAAQSLDGARMTAADVMTRLPATVHNSDSLWTAWGRLREARLRHLVVIDDHRRPLGVLDERTVALEWPPGPLGAHRMPVHTLLRGRARPRVRRGDDLAMVARTMVDARVEAVPVIDRDGRLFGLITLWHFAELAGYGSVAEERRSARADVVATSGTEGLSGGPGASAGVAEHKDLLARTVSEVRPRGPVAPTRH